MSTVAQAVTGGAEPLARSQARAVASAYIEEISVQAFTNPEGGETGAAEGETRSTFDDVWDYSTINGEAPSTATGQPFSVDGSSAGEGLSVLVAVSGNTDAQTGVAEVTVRVRGGNVDHSLQTRLRP